MIRKYVKYQEKHEADDKQLSLHEVWREGSMSPNLERSSGA